MASGTGGPVHKPDPVIPGGMELHIGAAEGAGAAEGTGAEGQQQQEAAGAGGEHAGGAAVQAFETEEFRYTFQNGDGTWRAKIAVPVNAKRHKPRKKKVKCEVQDLGRFHSREEAVLAAKRWIDKYYISWSSRPTGLGSRRKTEGTRIFATDEGDDDAGRARNHT